MDEILYTHILRSIGLVAGILGLLVGLDLLFGGPIVSVSKRVLDKNRPRRCIFSPFPNHAFSSH